MENVTATTSVSFADLLDRLLDMLSERERDILRRRHSLKPGGRQRKETLETIGRDYKVTRERVRQIERDGIRKLQDKATTEEITKQLEEIEAAMQQFLKKYGGAMQEDHLLDNLIDFFGISARPEVGDTEVLHHKKSLAFLISNLLADKFEQVGDDDTFMPTWKLKEAPWEFVEEVIDQLVQLIEGHGKPLTADELFTTLRNDASYSALQERFTALDHVEEELAELDETILAYLRASKRVKQNLFGHIGLSDWNTISPKRMNDKIYLVMKQAKKPLHFTEIAELINEAGFDHKKALPATIHNELILDDRYVLIGRGIYALREWGYEPGTVADVISALIAKHGPMTKDEIIEKVSEQRMVKKATINLALMNKERFVRRDDKRYDTTTA